MAKAIIYSLTRGRATGDEIGAQMFPTVAAAKHKADELYMPGDQYEVHERHTLDLPIRELVCSLLNRGFTWEDTERRALVVRETAKKRRARAASTQETAHG